MVHLHRRREYLVTPTVCWHGHRPTTQARKRRLPGVDCSVEARDMDDWMVVDAGNIIVSIMDAGECLHLLNIKSGNASVAFIHVAWRHAVVTQSVM